MTGPIAGGGKDGGGVGFFTGLSRRDSPIGGQWSVRVRLLSRG